MKTSIINYRDVKRLLQVHFQQIFDHFLKMDASSVLNPLVRCGKNGCGVLLEDQGKILKLTLDRSEADFYNSIQKRKVRSNAFCEGRVLGELTDAIDSITEYSPIVYVIEREYVLSLSQEESESFNDFPIILHPPLYGIEEKDRTAVFEASKNCPSDLLQEEKTLLTEKEKRISHEKRVEILYRLDVVNNAYVIAEWRSKLQEYIAIEPNTKAQEFASSVIDLIDEGVYLVDIKSDNVGIKHGAYCLFDVGLSDVVLFDS